MNEWVVDTMALVLKLERRRCPQQVRTIFEEAEHGLTTLYVPALVLVEIGYLSERGRIDATLDEATNYCRTHQTIEMMPLTHDIILRSFEIDDIPELHDRLIAGTAATLQLPLITNDPVIAHSSYLTVIW